MRVEIVSNNNLNLNNEVSFQKRRFSTLESALRDVVGIELGTTKSLSPTKAKRAIKTLLRMVNNHPSLQRVRFEVSNAKALELAKNTFRRKNTSPQMKKEIIDQLFALKTEGEEFRGSDLFKNYIFDELVPHIAETKDTEAAEHILTITDRHPTQRTIESVTERIKFIEQLGSKDHIEELKQYTGWPYGFPDYSDIVRKYDLQDIANSAKEAIKKLETNPNF